MVWSLFATLAGTGLADVLVRPGGALTLTTAIAVTALLVLVAHRGIARSRIPLEAQHGGSTWLRANSDAGMRPARIVVEAAGRPRPRAPSAAPSE